MTFEELLHLLKTAVFAEEIDDRREEIAELIPQVKRMFDFNQQNHAHQYDLWLHCVHTVLNLPKSINDDMLYLGALLHDIGKPVCQVKGKREDDTNMHYYGHPARSMQIVKEEVIPELIQKGYLRSEDQQRKLIYYVEYHDDRVSLRLGHLRRHLQMVSFEEFQNLMQLEVADAKAHVLIPIVQERIRICEQLAGEYGTELYERIKSGE